MSHSRKVAVGWTLGISAVCWVVAVRQMTGMNMGIGTQLGSLAFFLVAWASMMGAMMLPGAVPAVLRRVEAGDGLAGVGLFVLSYLAVWLLIGLAIYGAYRPHGADVAGAIVLGAGVYELSPLKRASRRRCRELAGSGVAFGIACVGSSIGLMLVLVALSVMSLAWMCVIAVLVLAQKLLPTRAIVDVPVVLALVGLGALILVAPSAVPGLLPPM